MLRSNPLTKVADWFDDRTGLRGATRSLTASLRPDPPRWGLALSLSTFWMFLVVVVTGVVLMTGYSPASDHGYSSVYLIESTAGGSFLRGLHYFGSHALIILFAIHLARMILAASFRAPRDLAWIAGVLLMPLLLLAAVTGNPLPAGNDALGQIEVEANIIGNLPLLGPALRGLLVGGEQVGHLTMTRLYTLHVVIVPLLAGLLLLLHISQQIRWSPRPTTAPENEDDENVLESVPASRSRQAGRNAIVFGVVFAAVALLAWKVGVPLGAPADPTLPSMPRPEWYFRALYGLRTGLPGVSEFLLTGLLPLVFLTFLVLLPWIDRLFSRSISGLFRYCVVIVAVTVWGGLTIASLAHDRNDPNYQQFLAQSEELAQRTKNLARLAGGIPPAGPVALLASDPKTQGPRLFRQHCANCHSYLDDEGNGIVAETPAASNLYGFGNREWVAGLLDPEQIATGEYFGHTAFVKQGTSGGMINLVKTQLYNVPKEKLDERREKVHKVILALSAEANLSYQQEADEADAAKIAAGLNLIVGKEINCVNCHTYGEKGPSLFAMGPDLTGYGSRKWMAAMISNPANEDFYGTSNDGMPAYHPVPKDSPDNILSNKELDLLIDWIRRDWVRVGQGRNIAQAEEPETPAAE